jgi:hypothetical protein
MASVVIGSGLIFVEITEIGKCSGACPSKEKCARSQNSADGIPVVAGRLHVDGRSKAVREFSMDDLHKRPIDKRFLALKEDYEVQKFERDVKAQKPSCNFGEYSFSVAGMR